MSERSLYGLVSLQGKVFIYRINDTPQGVEASQHRKHMFNGVCNGGQLQWERSSDRGTQTEENRGRINKLNNQRRLNKLQQWKMRPWQGKAASNALILIWSNFRCFRGKELYSKRTFEEIRVKNHWSWFTGKMMDYPICKISSFPE